MPPTPTASSGATLAAAFDIDPIVLKCLATEPGKRYATVGQLLEQLEAFEEKMRFQLLDELQGLKRGTSMILGPTGFLGKRGAIVLFVLIALTLVGIGGWMLLHPVAESPAPIETPATPAEPAAVASTASTPPTTAIWSSARPTSSSARATS